MDNTRPKKIYWRLIAPGAAILLVALINAGRINTPGTAWANGADRWPIALFIAVGGGLLLLGLVRSFGMRDTSR